MLGGPPSSPTLDLRVLHQDEEAVSQGGADGFCASKEQIESGHHQILHAEFRIWVVLFLPKITEDKKKVVFLFRPC